LRKQLPGHRVLNHMGKAKKRRGKESSGGSADVECHPEAPNRITPEIFSAKRLQLRERGRMEPSRKREGEKQGASWCKRIEGQKEKSRLVCSGGKNEGQGFCQNEAALGTNGGVCETVKGMGGNCSDRRKKRQTLLQQHNPKSKQNQGAPTTGGRTMFGDNPCTVGLPEVSDGMCRLSKKVIERARRDEREKGLNRSDGGNDGHAWNRDYVSQREKESRAISTIGSGSKASLHPLKIPPKPEAPRNEKKFTSSKNSQKQGYRMKRKRRRHHLSQVKISAEAGGSQRIGRIKPM